MVMQVKQCYIYLDYLTIYYYSDIQQDTTIEIVLKLIAESYHINRLEKCGE